MPTRPRIDPTAKRTFEIWRGSETGGNFERYSTEVSEGMVVLDVLHQLQAEQTPELAVRWNCKAGKCGSCSIEINGRPRLACMTRMNSFEPATTIHVAGLEMNPLDDDERLPELKHEYGSGKCNITRCCTEVCPEHIGITDNGIIPLKERVADRYYAPLAMIGRKLMGIKVRTEPRGSRGV